MHTLLLTSLLTAGTALSTPETLFVASYSGTITTLIFDDVAGTLTNTSVSLGCAPNPSWLTLDKPTNTLYCQDEGLTSPNGSLSNYAIAPDGSLTQKARTDTPDGPVYGSLYGPTNGAIALPHYAVSALSSFAVGPNASTLEFQQNISFPAPPPPPVSDPDYERQLDSHPHEAFLDPTGQYILVPDLGSDLVRVFTFDKESLRLRPAGEPLHAEPRSGPRHAAFYVNGDKTYMYLVTELSAQLFGFEVGYCPDNGGLTFTQFHASDTIGGSVAPGRVAPAEIRIAPGNEFLVVSNRNDSSFRLPNNDPKNATAMVSDSLATYAIAGNGSLEFAQLWPAGGRFPRNFDINKGGNRIAVGLQNDGRVVVMERDAGTGLIGRQLAVLGGADPDMVGQVTRVVWDEETGDDGVVGRA